MALLHLPPPALTATGLWGSEVQGFVKLSREQRWEGELRDKKTKEEGKARNLMAGVRLLEQVVSEVFAGKFGWNSTRPLLNS
ncbi:hypothetical protein GUJ93_ZPchr0006g40882 [Zizania palustris]|uniref:Uncharacterized protein n=1 Tax=Zizania palustris TaxID=103762 RepID=A0A8J5T6M4_ZIZPA|nr:hypothetical protein GUJ93_ZPchr0006g40882 [Zizania palustris]